MWLQLRHLQTYQEEPCQISVWIAFVNFQRRFSYTDYALKVSNIFRGRWLERFLGRQLRTSQVWWRRLAPLGEHVARICALLHVFVLSVEVWKLSVSVQRSIGVENQNINKSPFKQTPWNPSPLCQWRRCALALSEICAITQCTSTLVEYLYMWSRVSNCRGYKEVFKVMTTQERTSAWKNQVLWYVKPHAAAWSWYWKAVRWG